MSEVSIENIIVLLSLSIILLIVGFLIFLIFIGICDSVILLPFLGVVLGFYLGRITNKNNIKALEYSNEAIV